MTIPLLSSNSLNIPKFGSNLFIYTTTKKAYGRKNIQTYMHTLQTYKILFPFDAITLQNGKSLIKVCVCVRRDVRNPSLAALRIYAWRIVSCFARVTRTKTTSRPNLMIPAGGMHKPGETSLSNEPRAALRSSCSFQYQCRTHRHVGIGKYARREGLILKGRIYN